MLYSTILLIDYLQMSVKLFFFFFIVHIKIFVWCKLFLFYWFYWFLVSFLKLLVCLMRFIRFWAIVNEFQTIKSHTSILRTRVISVQRLIRFLKIKNSFYLLLYLLIWDFKIYWFFLIILNYLKKLILQAV